MKRTLSLLVALALVFTMIPAVFAADNKEDIDMDGLTQGMEIDNPTPAEINKPYTTTWLTFTREEGGEAHGVHYFEITADEDGNLELTVDANGTVALEGVTANDDGTYPVEAGKKYIVVVTKDAEATEESTWSATYVVEEDTDNADAPTAAVANATYTTEYDVHYYSLSITATARLDVATNGNRFVVMQDDEVLVDTTDSVTYIDVTKNNTYTVIVYGEGTTWSTTSSPISLYSMTLLYKDMIQIQYKYKFTLSDNVAEYGVLVFDSLEKAKTFDRGLAAEVLDLVLNGTTYEARTAGISARLMNESQFAVGFLKYEDGTYDYSIIKEYSPMIYARTKLSSTDPNTVLLCKALAHYGAAAQRYLDKVTDPDLLMNKGFPELPYDASVLGEEIYAADGQYYDGLKLHSMTMLFKGAITVQVKYRVTGSYDNVPVVKYTLGNREESTVDMEYDSVYNSTQETLYAANIAGISAKDLDEPLVVVPSYTINGEQKLGGQLTYSGYEYCRRIIKNSSDQNSVALAKAFAMYINAADKALG